MTNEPLEQHKRTKNKINNAPDYAVMERIANICGEQTKKKIEHSAYASKIYYVDLT